MTGWQLSTPVALMIFNRPETTEQVFAAIKQAKPPKLLVVADGPRKNKFDEAKQCEATRAIIEQVNWDCEVLTDFSIENLGCKNRIASGLDWVFKQVSEAIILEDDCLPHPTFFRFCEELLERYRNDNRIGMISGDNFQLGNTKIEDSYYFSRYTHIWGWATWRRAWQHYDRDMTLWPTLREQNWLTTLFGQRSQQKYWSHIFDNVYDGKIDTWDYQWCLTCWSRNLLAIMPEVNLVSNIGFDRKATHTRGASIIANLKLKCMDFPLEHPSNIAINSAADAYTWQTHLNNSLFCRLWRKVYAFSYKCRSL